MSVLVLESRGPKGFAKHYANHVLPARRVERLEETAEKYKKEYGVNILPIECPFSRNQAVIETGWEALQRAFAEQDLCGDCNGRVRCLP